MQLRKHVDEIISIFQIMIIDSDINCFQEFDIKQFRNRFLEKASEKEVKYIKYSVWIIVSILLTKV